MKIYRTIKGIVVEKNNQLYTQPNENWDEFINDDNLYKKLEGIVETTAPSEDGHVWINEGLLAPVGNQEVWASGVTYFKSKLGRQEESKDSGGGTFYEKVYNAERPELFMKSTGPRVKGHLEKVRIRKDSTWDVPEPELTLLVSSSGKILGYTIGNDMSSRSIEGENPLYLPQAKVYNGSAALGPCILLTEKTLAKDTEIKLEVIRDSNLIFSDAITIDQIKRDFAELITFLYAEYSFPVGSFLMTGTGIVPGSDFTLASRDVVKIHINGIGTLINTVE
ncbi:fumarylacetoacetate hydrolase family protein [Cyclobacterium amurskyense]|uniref:Fumarylacetoacetate hydrolase family protein n=1 Tax=Cyclobacterium amurskyense TaxID=320787 RepID=A0A0H4PZ32_9BACT|nr:fumarylacetoacetate hydrolase family protein [Cyclobacterium amurskyense]AKP53687.1 Fumarylacetoacetate hydrolase family protein [Cyclobacterium amurskyense]|tara:strand:+ start:498 stop:1334 length:837 start_codon:yes stop_codon:yes gene_type:complete